MRRPGLADWLRAMLSRYRPFLAEAWPPAFVFGTGAPRPSPAHVVVRQSHLRVAQTWAPRLQLILVTGSAPAAGSVAAPQVRRLQPGSPVVWRLLHDRPAPAAPMSPVRTLTATVSAASALATVSRIEQRAAPVDSVQPLRPLPGSAPTPGALDERAPVVFPAAPVARVVHRGGPLSSAAGPSSDASPAVPPWEPPVATQRRSVTAPAPAALDADPVAIDRITDRVMQQIGHRIQAHRERMGRA
ncbi:MAG TPA: hypothetical protein VIH05_07985 [Tepidiformaceae bacterium]